jgi:hypothetical protein
MKAVTIVHNAVHAKLTDADDNTKTVVQELLSFTKERGAGTWDGKGSFLEWNEGVFPRGFVTLVQAKLMQLGFKVRVVKKPYPAPLGESFPMVDAFGEDPRYDYQRQVYDLVLRHGQIIAQIATGGGKSRVAKLTLPSHQAPDALSHHPRHSDAPDGPRRAGNGRGRGRLR